MNYTVVNRKTNIYHIQKLNEKRTQISSLSKEEVDYLEEMNGILYERLPSSTDAVNFRRVAEAAKEVKRDKELRANKVRTLENIETKAGFALTSSIILLGIITMGFAVFMFARNMLLGG